MAVDFKSIFNIERFKQKLGPLPVWAWGLILGIIAVLVYYAFLKNRGATADDTSVGTTADDQAQTDWNSADDAVNDWVASIGGADQAISDLTPPTPTSGGVSSGTSSSSFSGGYDAAWSPASDAGAAVDMSGQPVKTPSGIGKLPGGYGAQLNVPINTPAVTYATDSRKAFNNLTTGFNGQALSPFDSGSLLINILAYPFIQAANVIKYYSSPAPTKMASGPNRDSLAGIPSYGGAGGGQSVALTQNLTNQIAGADIAKNLGSSPAKVTTPAVAAPAPANNVSQPASTYIAPKAVAPAPPKAAPAPAPAPAPKGVAAAPPKKTPKGIGKV